ncbi:hypothetical protein [Amycolatopsis sp. NBC_01480]|nr:hypothetical protein [Amycolatopsis sp. NBC_01480]
MWQTLLGLAPLTVVALGLGTWTCWDIARSFRAPGEDARGGRRG